jgi:hypothetical protein
MSENIFESEEHNREHMLNVSQNESTVEILCAICLCPVDLEEISKYESFWCQEAHENSSVHLDCMAMLIANRVNNAFPGTCPVISCPCIHQQRNKEKENVNGYVAEYPDRTFIIPFGTWTRWLDENDMSWTNRYRELASNLLPFLCSGCHISHTIEVPFETDTERQQEIRSGVVYSLPETKARSFEATLKKYLHGNVSINDFYTYLQKHCYGSNKMPWSSFKALLSLVEDPERKNNLHLRYLRDNREFRTPCCDTMHCWSCKSKPHPGFTCEINQNKLDSEILECLGCGVHISKGDGCDSVKCPCGRWINWAQEKRQQELSNRFIKAFPRDTPLAAAAYMYDIPKLGMVSGLVKSTDKSQFIAELPNARAFRQRNQIEVDRIMLDMFQRRSTLRAEIAAKGVWCMRKL